jgi:hypothetical protein
MKPKVFRISSNSAVAKVFDYGPARIIAERQPNIVEWKLALPDAEISVREVSHCENVCLLVTSKDPGTDAARLAEWSVWKRTPSFGHANHGNATLMRPIHGLLKSCGPSASISGIALPRPLHLLLH